MEFSNVPSWLSFIEVVESRSFSDSFLVVINRNHCDFGVNQVNVIVSGASTEHSVFIEGHREYFGPVWYVSNDGNDFDGYGTMNAPFRNIAFAVNNSSDGDTVIALPGTYTESFGIDKNLYFRGLDDPDSTILQSIGSNYHNIKIVADSVKISNFTFDNELDIENVQTIIIDSVKHSSNHSGYNFLLDNVENFTLSNSEFILPSYRESAFIDGNGGTRFRFDNIDVRMNGGPSGNRRFIDLVGSYATFENCKFYEVGSIINPGDTLLIYNSIFRDGIYHAIINETGDDYVHIKNSDFGGYESSDRGLIMLQSGRVDVDSTRFIGNIYYDGGSAIVSINGPIQATNSTFINNSGGNQYWQSSVIQFSLSEPYSSFESCVFFNNEGFVMGGPNSSSSASGEVTINNCIIYDNELGNSIWINVDFNASYSCIEEEACRWTGNISTDPLFCNPFEFPLTLQNSSGCVGSGFENQNIGNLNTGCDIRQSKYYVSINGNSDGTGTLSNTLDKIQFTIEQISNHDTVIVLPGLYDEDLVLDGKSIVLSSSYLTIQDSSIIDETIINGSVKLNGVDSTSLTNGFTIANSSEDGFEVYGNSTSTLSNSKIHSSESRGIVISGSNVNLLNVSSRRNNTNNTQGLSGVGIYVFDSDISFNSVIIDSNMNFDHNGDGAGVYIYESDGKYLI